MGLEVDSLEYYRVICMDMDICVQIDEGGSGGRGGRCAVGILGAKIKKSYKSSFLFTQHILYDKNIATSGMKVTYLSLEMRQFTLEIETGHLVQSLTDYVSANED